VTFVKDFRLFEGLVDLLDSAGTECDQKTEKYVLHSLKIRKATQIEWLSVKEGG
jgi:hypothetical protein